MWLPGEGGMSGFWAITRYEDIKQVELAHNVFSSQRGGINISVLMKTGRPEKLVPAALNLSSISMSRYIGICVCNRMSFFSSLC